MKKLFLWSALFLAAVAGISVYLALDMGEKSPVFATGRVSISGDLVASAKGIRTLYLIVYDADSEMPMPYGAIQETLTQDAAGDFYDFFITSERLRVMNPNLPRPRNLRLKARLDADGKGGLDLPGDLTGEVRPIAFGSRDVSITINRVISQAAQTLR